MVEDDDLRDVMKAEKSRGRRPVDIAALRERQRFLQVLRELLEDDNLEGFLNAIRAYGLREGMPQFEAALRAWREKRKL